MFSRGTPLSIQSAEFGSRSPAFVRPPQTLEQALAQEIGPRGGILRVLASNERGSNGCSAQELSEIIKFDIEKTTAALHDLVTARQIAKVAPQSDRYILTPGTKEAMEWLDAAPRLPRRR